MSVSDKLYQEQKDLAQTTDSGGSAHMDWFSLTNVSAFKAFRDLAHQNLTSLKGS
jgi:hypothetical protein